MTDRHPCCDELGAVIRTGPPPWQTMLRRADGSVALTVRVPATLDVGTFIVRHHPIRFCPFCGTELPKPAT